MSRPTNPRNRKYRIAPPESYSAAPMPRPEPPAPAAPAAAAFPEKLAPPAAPPPAKKAAPAPPAREKRAVWIVHGMGQQVPFETQDSLAEGIMRVSQPVAGQDDFEPRVRTVKIGDSTVQRIEIDVAANSREFELHLYESYWAPITEGQVKLKDVTGFLFDGSFRGLWNSIKTFRRAMFDQVAEFKIHKRAALEIFAALLTLTSLIVLNSVIIAAGAAKFYQQGAKLPAIEQNWESLTAGASGLSAVAILFGIVLFLAGATKPPSLPKTARSLVNVSVWAAFAITLLSVSLGALYLGLEAATRYGWLAMSPEHAASMRGLATFTILCGVALVLLSLILRGSKRSSGLDLRQLSIFLPFFVLSFLLFLVAFFGPFYISFTSGSLCPVSPRFTGFLQSSLWVWPFLFLLSANVRQILIQYVGDVAAYITANKVDRFYEIRRKIKEVALKSASAVYLAEEGGDFLYAKIAVVGHSLGSVIAYDTLNALLANDALTGGKLRVAKRTCLLETFGSPLDKIAFFFTVQGTDTFHLREQLAASVQPLISDYQRYRPFPWINVYSKNDIVSGRVDLYDLPLKDQPPAIQQLIKDHAVQHVQDSDAIIPLVAHVDYWRNTEIWTRLCSALTA